MIPGLIAAGSSIASSLLGAHSARKAAKKNYENQKEFAQKGIQWKVGDAKKAGVHPLFALGAQTTSFAPSAVGADYSGIAQAGQQIDRAVSAGQTQSGRAGTMALKLAQVQLEGAELDNDIKRARLVSDIARTGQAGQVPPLPSPSTRWFLDGQGDGPASEIGELEYKRKVAPPEPGQPQLEAGANPEIALYKTVNGGYAPMVPQGLSESFEQDWISYYQWLARNKIAPAFGKNMSPPVAVPIPKGFKWKYNGLKGEYELVPRKPFRYPRGGRLSTNVRYR